MRKIVCLCEHKFEMDFPEEITLEDEIRDAILDGSFMNVTCPQCKTVLKPELPFCLKDTSHDLDIFFIPECDRTAFLMQKLSYDIGEPGRVVIGYKELVEKLKLQSAGLDDRAVEILKYYILSKAKSTSASEDIFIYFHALQETGLVFYIEGLKDGEIGQYEVSRDLYAKAVKDLEKKEKDPAFATFLTPPYVSLNKVSVE